MFDVKASDKIDYDGKQWVVGQIQPDHQLVYLEPPTQRNQQKGVWVRKVGRDFIPYDILQGRPLIEIPRSAEIVLDALSTQQHGNEGKPRR